MQTNVESLIEAARRLPPAEQRRLAEALADTAESVATNPSRSSSRRGFPISKGRVSFTSADVARIESDSDINT